MKASWIERKRVWVWTVFRTLFSSLPCQRTFIKDWKKKLHESSILEVFDSSNIVVLLRIKRHSMLSWAERLSMHHTRRTAKNLLFYISFLSRKSNKDISKAVHIQDKTISQVHTKIYLQKKLLRKKKRNIKASKSKRESIVVVKSNVQCWQQELVQ